jgi:hypothetical protein
MIRVNHRAGCDGVLCENDHDPFFRLLALGRTNNLCLQESQQWIRSQPALSFTMNVPSAQPSLLTICNASSSFYRMEEPAKWFTSSKRLAIYLPQDVKAIWLPSLFLSMVLLSLTVL